MRSAPDSVEQDKEVGIEILEGTFQTTSRHGTSNSHHSEQNIEDMEIDGQGISQYHHHQRRFPVLLEKGQRTHSTASSFSGRHFGHYAAAARSDALSEVHAQHLVLITKTGAAPNRWSKGLSVMLEKVAGVAVVTKLCAILLMEADAKEAVPAHRRSTGLI